MATVATPHGNFRILLDESNPSVIFFSEENSDFSNTHYLVSNISGLSNTYMKKCTLFSYREIFHCDVTFDVIDYLHLIFHENLDYSVCRNRYWNSHLYEAK